MPPQLALLLGWVFILWLFAKDLKARPEVSHATWIPFVWAFLIGSKSIYLWLGIGFSGDDAADGSPLDRMIFLALIMAGLVVLSRRRVDFGAIVSANKWMFIFLLYLGVSVLWSDYPFTSFKRWIKEIGNIVMVLVILTEVNPIDAARAVFVRCGYILVTLSVVYIKYFPDIGRAYNQWTWENMYVGVTQQKNSLGALALVCGLFLLMDWLVMRVKRPEVVDKRQMYARLLLLGMCAWLLYMSNSKTSLSCTLLGAALLFSFKVKRLQNIARFTATYVVLITVTFLVLDNLLGVRAMLFELLGRDSTLTQRTDIWGLVLEQPINPLIGTGFYSFWTGPRADAIHEVFKGINQCHNGYLETYLNSGIIGVCLLVAFILATYRSILTRLKSGEPFAQMRFVLWIVTLLYNVSEAAFSHLGIVWMAYLLIAFDFPLLRRSTTDSTTDEVEAQSEFIEKASKPDCGNFIASPNIPTHQLSSTK